MIREDDDLPDRGGDDLTAAEYVLGVLDRDERAAAAARIERDPAFARLVDRWEMHLAPLAEAYPSNEPPVAAKAALERRLFSGSATVSRSGAAFSIWSSLAFWRGLAAAGIAAFAVALAVPYFSPVLAPSDTSYMAMLKADASDVSYAAMYEEGEGRIALAHVSGTRAADRDFELWMIEGSSPPMSMGVLPAGDMITISLTPEVRDKLAAGAVLAISLEPMGGSPTGQPTGPVVAAGDLKSI
jgi:anti-sigma-K factor RskA